MITVYGYAGEPTGQLRDTVAAAALVVGGQRHLDALAVPAHLRILLGPIGPAVDALAALDPALPAVVIASGDPLFYGVVRRLRAAGLRCRLDELSATMKDHKFWKHTVILVGPALAATPLVKRSHLYHPGFRHEFRAADPDAARALAERGAVVDETRAARS